jgi:hypothetical protein
LLFSLSVHGRPVAGLCAHAGLVMLEVWHDFPVLMGKEATGHDEF